MLNSLLILTFDSLKFKFKLISCLDNSHQKMNEEDGYIYKRYNTDERLSSKKYFHQYRDQQSVMDEQSIQENSCDDKFFTQSQDNNNDILSDFINQEHQIRSRYMTCFNQEDGEDSINVRLPLRIKNLMKGLKELIKELCLTRNAANEVEQELEKLIGEFVESIPVSKQRIQNPQRSLISGISQIRVRTNYQILQNSMDYASEEQMIPGTRFFNKFLEGTPLEDEKSLKQTKINTYQQQLLEEYIEKYLYLLQKQVNRISRYNGEKKLKYLLETVMKQVFLQLMRFTYQTKIEIFKRQKKNLIHSPLTKTKILTSTINRLLNSSSLIHSAFVSIKSSITAQINSDSDLVNKFEAKISYLDNLMKVKERKDVRQKFMVWRKSTIITKQVQKQFILDGVGDLIKEILYEFALNESQLQKWKLIVWNKINSFIKSLCKFGESILFPVDEDYLLQNQSIQNSRISSQQQSRITSNRESDTFRYSPYSSGQQEENFQMEKRIFEQMHEMFSIDQIKDCLKHGKIMMNNTESTKLMLIPVKSVSAIIALKYSLQESSSRESSSNFNINSFYNILTALEVASPMILELMQLKEKFEFFSQKIKDKSHHQIILKSLLEPKLLKIDSTNKKESPQTKFSHRKLHSVYCDQISFTNRQQQNSRLLQPNNQLIKIDQILTQMNVKCLFMHHKHQKSYLQCLKYSVGDHQFEAQKFIGKDIVEAIFTQLQKVNKNQTQPLKCLYLKKSDLTCYACPIVQNQTLVGFVQIHLEEDFKNQIDLPKLTNTNENTYIVKTLDSRNQAVDETMLFVCKAVVPMLMTIQQDHSRANSLKNEECQICKSDIKMRTHQQSIKLKDFQSKEINCLNLKEINILFSRVNQLQFSDKQFLQMEKQIYQLIERKSIALNSEQKSHSLETILIGEQFFMKVFYLQTPRTKDKKLFTSHLEQSIKPSEINFYHIDSQSLNDNKKEIKLPFIDMLKLYDSNHQTMQIPVNRLIQVYRQMIRNTKSKNQNIAKTIINKSTEINDLQYFLEQVLKTILFKTDQISLQFDKRYHTLQLWLYQIQHLNKQFDDLKINLKINFIPVFSFLDGKNRFLSAVTCQGGFMINTQSNDQNDKQKAHKLSRKNESMNSFIKQINKEFMGRFIELQIKNICINLAESKISLEKKPTDVQQDKKISLNLKNLNEKPLSKIENTKRRLFNTNQKQIQKLISGILQLQTEVNLLKKIGARKIINDKFSRNYHNKKFSILNRMTIIINRKLICKNLGKKIAIFSDFIHKLSSFLTMRSEHYLVNSINFVQKMGNVFIRNKMLKTSFQKLKQSNSQHNLITDQLFDSNIHLMKKFAVERLNKIILTKLVRPQDSKQSILGSCFSTIKQFSNYSQVISNIDKQAAAIKINSVLEKFICKKSYLPYFLHLQQLQKSLYESISLIGTEIENVNFYSLHQFLKFINQRISIIIKSEKRLISVLYGSFIRKINILLISQNLETTQIYSLSLAENDAEIMSLEKYDQQKLNKSVNLIKIDGIRNKFYFSFQFVEDEDQQKSSKSKIIFFNFQSIIKKVFEKNISTAFEKFFSLYEKKINTFILKVSKVLKIEVHFSKKNLNTQKEQEGILKKYVFRKMQSEIVMPSKINKINEVQSQVQRKSKELQQLQLLYEKRAKKLVSSQKSEKKLTEQSQDSDVKNIITKTVIKSMKRNIESMDMNSENLSIQYQIKSKTVAGYQMMDIINNMERKQALMSVAESLITLSEKSVQYQNQSSRWNIWSQTERGVPLCMPKSLLAEEKQKLKHLNVYDNEERAFYSEKFHKVGARSISKVLKNLSKATFKKIFYRINSYSCLNSPRLIR